MDHTAQCRCPLCDCKTGPDFLHDNTNEALVKSLMGAVDRGCAIFDGNCECPRPVYDNCIKYVQFVHDEYHLK